MKVLHVTYRLRAPGQDWTDVLNVIRQYPSVCVGTSSYLIETAESPSVAYQKLRPFLDANDTLYVIAPDGSCDGHGPREVNEWLRARSPAQKRPTPLSPLPRVKFGGAGVPGAEAATWQYLNRLAAKQRRTG